MRKTKKNRIRAKLNNAIDPAFASIRWGKRTKKYKGCAGRDGTTTNFEIPEWMFDKELEEYMNGGVVNA